jgi:DNA helicase-2/ATP-dependent DNA helicase PcrA
VQVEDYLVCPLKYKFRHLLRIPVLPHHTLVFGRVLHAAVHADLCARQKGRPLAEEELIRRYEELWTNEGFLSREHEELRKKEGERALRRFHAREDALGRTPACLEKSFKWQAGRVRFVGRFDRIDLTPEGAVIIDYKASEAASEKEADRLTAASLQMDIYALSYLRTEGAPPAETRLHFLGSGIEGRAVKGEREFARALERIRSAEEGIRAGDYDAKPEWESCRTCEFKAICPSSYAY